MPLLQLPLSPFQALNYVIVPALKELGAKFDSPAARVLLLTISQQESALAARRQKPRGPARGLFQFERGGGVARVLSDADTVELAKAACRRHRVGVNETSAHAALEHDDQLAAVFARLLLWADPKPLPALGNVEAAWAYYLRMWAPGTPRPEKWPLNYATALKAVQA